MTVAMILEVSDVMEARNLTAWGILGMPVQPGMLVPVVPLAAPPAADAADGEPTWEDAAWQ
jgi:hypothetical protein